MSNSASSSAAPQSTKARFICSSPGLKGCPKPDMPEHAFIGRSNVGKSSLINMITRHKGLAKTSSTPGKTRLINHFVIDDRWLLADLPGYGYAKVSKSQRETWPSLIRNYLIQRKNLLNTFVLIDIRLEPQTIDMEFIRWLGTHQLPFAIVFTKSDKLSKVKTKDSVDSYCQTLLEEWEELPPVFITSSTKGTGREEILEFILEANKVISGK